MKEYTVAEYAQHLATAGRRLDPLMTRTMNRAGFNIRDDWRKAAREKNPKHAHQYPGTIRLGRTIVVDGQVTVTVEPGFFGQGPLAVILERGSPTSRAQRSDVAALEAEAPNLLRWLRKAAADNIR